MTALTTAQLDGLDDDVATIREHGYRIGVRSINTDAETLARLVAIARAALAWSEARRHADSRDCPDESVAETRTAERLIAAIEGAP